MMTRNAARAALCTAGIVLAAVGFWAGKSLTTSTITPSVMTGTVGLVGGSGDEFTIRLTGQRQQTGFGLPDTISWRDAYGVWQQGERPACMPPLSHGQRIRLGVIEAAPVAGAAGGPLIVWLECPSRAIPHYPIVTPPTR